MTWAEGDRVCNVGRDGARQASVGGFSWPIWTGAVYELQRRKKDGQLRWVRVGSYGGTRSGIRPSDLFVRRLQEQAAYPWLHVRHNQIQEGGPCAKNQTTDTR